MLKSISAVMLCSALAFGAISTPETTLDAHLRLTPPDSTDSRQLSFTLATPKGDVALPTPAIEDASQTITVTYKLPDCVWKTIFEPKGALILASSTITATGNDELLLEPGFAIDCAPCEPEEFWHGHNTMIPVEDKPLARRGTKGSVVESTTGASTMPFPANAVCKGTRAFYLGTYPYECLSYTAASYNPADKLFKASVRIVVSKGQTVSFRQVVGTVDAPYGIQTAIVQRFYEAFPEVYTPVGGQENPFIWGCESHYLSWWFKPSAELNRRFHSTIEWTYTPYRRSGEMLCDTALWDYTPANTFRAQKGELGGIISNLGKVECIPYRNLIKERFLKFGQQFGWMFYNTVAGTWCEKQLALEKYPDSINHDCDGGVNEAQKTWSTHHDAELRVLPYHTSFAKVFERDMATLTREYDLPGFALDCSYGGAYYRGPATKLPIQGRAWDDKGVFIDQSVAINHEVDVIHSLKDKEGKTLTVFFNGYLKGDYCMIETSFTDTGKMARWMPRTRWLVGPRPAGMHANGFDIQNVLPDWRNMKIEKFWEMLGRISDFEILNQFYYGACNDYLSMYGNPQMLYIQPEALELMRYGWQAELPFNVMVKNNSKVRYQARYGTAENTILYFGNSSPKDADCSFDIDNSRLTRDGSAVVFVRKMRDHALTLNRIADGKTSFDAVIASRTPTLFESIATLTNAKGTITAKSQKTLATQVFTMTSDTSFSSVVKPRAIRNYRLKSIAVNGRPMPLKDGAADVTFAPGATVAITYESTAFACQAEQILAFPFTNAKNNVSCRVVATPGAKDAANRFVEYFDFCKEHKGIDTKSPSVAVTITDVPVPAANTILVKLDTLTRVAIDTATGGLIVTAPTQKALGNVLTELFYVMDRRYPCNLGFKSVMGLLTPVCNHFKLYGKTLPMRRYFEEEAAK